MNLEQALEIVQDHIRIGKGMELVNGVPEALEMVVDELMVMQKSLELANDELFDEMDFKGECPKTWYGINKPECTNDNFFCERDHKSCWRDYFLQQAKEV
mgnify:CR=1 FL=1